MKKEFLTYKKQIVLLEPDTVTDALPMLSTHNLKGIKKGK